MRDVPGGCEKAVAQLDRWIAALMAGDIEQLENILAHDFQFTAEPKFAGGRMDKARFIEMDRQIRNCSIELLSVTARRFGEMVTTLVFAEVREEFVGDLGFDMPSTSEMTAAMNGARLAYGSGWRENKDGTWRCFSHHIFGWA